MAGIILHELFHLLMCVLTNTPVDEVKFLERVKMSDSHGNTLYSYGGRVILREKKEITFLQALLIGLAPLMFSFWIFFFILDYLFSVSEIEPLYFFLLVFLMISIVLAAAPSAKDLLNIPASFQNNPSYSLYQVGLLILSISSVWILSLFINLVAFHEIIYYILIALFYYAFNYGIKGIQIIIHSTSSSNFRLSIKKSNKNK